MNLLDKEIQDLLEKLDDPDEKIYMTALHILSERVHQKYNLGLFRQQDNSHIIETLKQCLTNPRFKTETVIIKDMIIKLEPSGYELPSSSKLISIDINERITVGNLLKKLKIPLHKSMAVLVDGKKAELNQELQPGQEVIVLPMIGGGIA